LDSLEAVNATLRSHERELSSHHRSIGELRGVSSVHETSIKVIDTMLRETREDLARLETSLMDELSWVRKGMWSAAAFFLATFVGVLVQLFATH
jgi:hypothetical protein